MLCKVSPPAYSRCETGKPQGGEQPHGNKEVDWAPFWKYPDLWTHHRYRRACQVFSEPFQGQQGVRRSWPSAKKERGGSNSRRKMSEEILMRYSEKSGTLKYGCWFLRKWQTLRCHVRRGEGGVTKGLEVSLLAMCCLMLMPLSIASKLKEVSWSVMPEPTSSTLGIWRVLKERAKCMNRLGSREPSKKKSTCSSSNYLFYGSEPYLPLIKLWRLPYLNFYLFELFHLYYIFPILNYVVYWMFPLRNHIVHSDSSWYWMLV